VNVLKNGKSSVNIKPLNKLLSLNQFNKLLIIYNLLIVGVSNMRYNCKVDSNIDVLGIFSVKFIYNFDISCTKLSA